MSHLLDAFGRGLLAHLSGAFADILGRPGDYDFDELRDSVDADPSDVAVRVRLGAAFLHEEEPAFARDCFLETLKIDRDCLPARIGLACAFDELNRTEVALEQLRIAQKKDPLNPAVLFCLGYCNERLGLLDQAVDLYEDSLHLCPTLRNAHERLAAIALNRGDVDTAVAAYERLGELDSDQVDVHLTLAGLLLKAGRYDDAIQRYEHAIAMEPDNWEARDDTVTAYEEAGLIREAIEHLHTMLDTDADFPDTRLRLGDLYARVGDDASAMSNYERALELCPDHMEANVKLGTQHLRGGRFADAAQSFSQALELNDRLISAYIGAGVAQHATGKTDDALQSFEIARSIEPNSSLLFSEVARMQLKADFSKASDAALAPAPDPSIACPSVDVVDDPKQDLIATQIEKLRDAIRRHPNHADLHYRLGLLLRNRGQIEDAIDAYTAAIEINPCYIKALIKLGLAQKEMDRVDDATETFARAMKVQPDYLDVHYQLGLLFAQRHQFETALEHFESAAEGNPRNLDFQANLAVALQNVGLIDRARATWRLICELDPESEHALQANVALAKTKPQQ